ncbi:hypothetical protein G3N96_23260 [Burkholderia sp. Se-20373]|uniref:hypothetical protein n=1 Tax=Burkholderia sp. Se-20373 TaxID=2703898 RepID=UPI001980F6BB|nr:hypothetical protein [Burkholderia sp. Se-20373]MBN3748319.1 hypothetical protein [Burkholderia sp. Se-20373]
MFNQDRTAGGNEPRGHASGNSKIFYQYLRGEREPRPGPRGKYGQNLTASIRELPGGVVAHQWSTSPIWALIEGDVSLEFVRGILSLLEEPLPGMPALEYVRIWTHYRLAILEHAPEEEQQEWARAIAHLHSVAKTDDPVFCYISGPLDHYFLAHEPQIPLAPHPPKKRWKSRLFVKMEEAAKRNRLRSSRFDNGVSRFGSSGRRPDRRFLKEFATEWSAHLRWNDAWKALRAEEEESRHPKAGWKLLYEAWNIPTSSKKYL